MYSYSVDNVEDSSTFPLMTYPCLPWLGGSEICHKWKIKI